jgi:CBS domain containing-hemolysin-like protein
MDKPPSSDSHDIPPAIKRLLQFLGLGKSPDSAEDLEQEIHELLEEGAEQGLISSHEGHLINSIFEFRETLAHEIMTPRAEMICIPADSTANEVTNLIIEKGFSRIPVYSDTPDNIIGTIHAKDLLACSATSPPPAAAEITKPAHFVLENQKIADLLREFQAKKTHMAIVTDEFGGIRGLITLEDIIEEIVGEISDEYDKSETRWKVLDKNTLVTDAKTDIEHIESFFHTEIPEGPYESVGGLIIHILGRVPETGAVAECDGLVLHVVLATKRRIITVKIQKNLL